MNPVSKKMGEIKDGWYYCPNGHKTGQRITSKTNAVNLPVWCKHCRKAYYPVIRCGKICENNSDYVCIDGEIFESGLVRVENLSPCDIPEITFVPKEKINEMNLLVRKRIMRIF